jgi:hypothetical protein
MTDQQHPIAPPPELVEQWYDSIDNASTSWKQELATQAARWGFKQCMELDASWLEAKLQKARDEELEACCEWLQEIGPSEVWLCGDDLRQARRPQPSLKEQALKALTKIEDNGATYLDSSVIRRALEQLND